MRVTGERARAMGAACGLGLSVALFGGCDAMGLAAGEARSVRDRVLMVDAVVDAQIAAARGELEGLEPGDPRGAVLAARLDRLEALRSASVSASGRLERLLREAGVDPDSAGGSDWDAVWDRTERLGDAVGGAIGGPVGVPVALGIGLVAALGRAAQLKRSVRSIATGLERAVGEDPELAAALERNAETLRAVQTKTARRLVERASRGGSGIELPV